MRLVLIGKTGVGKSSTGNTLLGKKHFLAQAKATSVTTDCSDGKREFNGRSISVVDTPGIHDTHLTPTETLEQITKCINMSKPGPHAFLLIVQATRFTEEEYLSFCCLSDVFQSNMENFVIVVFTRLDDLDEEDSSIQNYLKTAPSNLKSFLQKCNNRYYAINNRAEATVKETYLKELMVMVDEITRLNGGQHYTNPMYIEVDNLYFDQLRKADKKRHIKAITSKFSEELQFKESKLDNILQTNFLLLDKLLESMDKHYEHLEHANSQLETEIRDLKKRLDKKGCSIS